MTKSNMESELIQAPIRALKRARDFYIRGLWDCSGKLGPGAGNLMGCPAPPPPLSTMPRSFSELTSGDEDLRELIRVSSRRSLRGKVGAEVLRRGQPTPAAVDSAPGRGGLPKAGPCRGVVVVAIGRIDEEKWYTS
ncbi:unnamed protein product [Cuscuta epithymum]|uniref:Uncharacterized protein n=1 Tax=Cuscuta epithymum TaxID=186058 RepID=A0AAV0DWL1_9ASTE|nr:unnamed protein product [Cuscuta epithymum]